MRSDRRHLENINAIFITEKGVGKDRKSNKKKKPVLEALEFAYIESIPLLFLLN